ncbi:MAG: F0F1 ATP synthase subunit delta [Streptosporangiaceae bacterium]
MRGSSRMSFAELRDQLPEVLAESGRSTSLRPGPASAGTTGAAGSGPGRTAAGTSGVVGSGPESTAAESTPTGSTPTRSTRAGSTAAGSTAAGSTAAGSTAAGGPGTAASLAATVGDELFAVLHLLDAEHGLRRALADPSKPADEKGAIVVALLHGKVAPATEELVAATVRAQWAGPADMTDALEQLAVEAYAIAAEETGQLDDLEDELFRFSRVVANEPELRAALSEPVLPNEGKQGLINTLLAGKVTPVTLRLITEMSLHPRGRPLVVSLDMCTRIAAERRQRLIAVVRTATDLSAEQRRRLADALAGIYGHEVYINIVIDPKVIGGVTIQVGDELIDASAASRLAAVRRKLAG